MNRREALKQLAWLAAAAAGTSAPRLAEGATGGA